MCCNDGDGNNRLRVTWIASPPESDTQTLSTNKHMDWHEWVHINDYRTLWSDMAECIWIIITHIYYIRTVEYLKYLHYSSRQVIEVEFILFKTEEVLKATESDGGWLTTEGEKP